MTKKNDTLDQLTELTRQLQQVRQDSLAASRREDYRAVARLTCEAARLNRAILTAEGTRVPILIDPGDRFFVSSSDTVEAFTETSDEALLVAQSA